MVYVKAFFFVLRRCVAAIFSAVGFHELEVDVLNVYSSTGRLLRK